MARALPDADSAYGAQEALESEQASKVLRYSLQQISLFKQSASLLADLPPNPHDYAKPLAEQWTRRMDLLCHMQTAVEVNCTGSLSHVNPVKVYPHHINAYDSDSLLVSDMDASVRYDAIASKRANL